MEQNHKLSFEEVNKLVDQLSPLEKHQILLKLVQPYRFGYEGSELHICYACNLRDFERGGWGTSVDFFHCEERDCPVSYCMNCLKSNEKELVSSFDNDKDEMICNRH